MPTISARCFAPLSQEQLAGKISFRVALARSALHPAQPREASECFRVEPMLGPLRAEVFHKKIDLALHDVFPDLDIKVRLTEIAIPLRNFVFKDQVIAKRIPSVTTNFAMILVGVVAPVGQDKV